MRPPPAPPFSVSVPAAGISFPASLPPVLLSPRYQPLTPDPRPHPLLKNLQHTPPPPSKPSLEGAGTSSFTPQLVLLSQSDPTISGLARRTTLTPLFQRSPLMSQSPESCGGILVARRAGRNLNLTLNPPPTETRLSSLSRQRWLRYGLSAAQ